MKTETKNTAETEILTEDSLSEHVYQQVKNKIIFFHYEPGQFLTETMLASEYQVSKMPVKLAMRKLKKEGWLVANFRQKTRVKDITENDIRCIYEFRFLIENNALDLVFQKQLAAKYADLLGEKLMQVKAKSDDPQCYLITERTIHVALVSVYENERISNVYSHLQDEIIRISYMANMSESSVGDTSYTYRPFKSWQSLIEYLRAGEYLLAKQELLDHLQLGQKKAMQALEKWQQMRHEAKTEIVLPIKIVKGD